MLLQQSSARDAIRGRQVVVLEHQNPRAQPARLDLLDDPEVVTFGVDVDEIDPFDPVAAAQRVECYAGHRLANQLILDVGNTVLVRQDYLPRKGTRVSMGVQ